MELKGAQTVAERRIVKYKLGRLLWGILETRRKEELGTYDILEILGN